jgi:hypothetical protein
MNLPDFLIIGAQKSGTTWASKILEQHPEVYIPNKEIHFFNKEKNYKKGLEWYETHFNNGTDNQIIGEKTPNYLWVTNKIIKTKFGNNMPFINKIIYDTLPNSKLIALLRNPVERAISAVNHYRTHGELSPFDDINEILIGKKKNLAYKYGIISMGMYYHHLMAFYEYFDPNQILILIYEEDVIKNPEKGVNKICTFLNIDPLYEFKNLQEKIGEYSQIGTFMALGYMHSSLRPIINKANKYLPQIITGPSVKKIRPNESAIEKMYDIYAESNNNLFKLLGRPILSWNRESL